MPVSCPGSLDTVSQSVLSTVEGRTRELERLTRTRSIYNYTFIASLISVNIRSTPGQIFPLHQARPGDIFIPVMTFIHHQCLPVFCFNNQLIKKRRKNCAQKHLVMQQSVTTCHSVPNRKLFNVYDKVSPAMIMSHSRSSLMILVIFDPADSRWFLCTFQTLGFWIPPGQAGRNS